LLLCVTTETIEIAISAANIGSSSSTARRESRRSGQ